MWQLFSEHMATRSAKPRAPPLHQGLRLALAQGHPQRPQRLHLLGTQAIRVGINVEIHDAPGLPGETGRRLSRRALAPVGSAKG